jgi:Sec-independent protein translocase protein TatA
MTPLPETDDLLEQAQTRDKRNLRVGCGVAIAFLAAALLLVLGTSRVGQTIQDARQDLRAEQDTNRVRREQVRSVTRELQSKHESLQVSKTQLLRVPVDQRIRELRKEMEKKDDELVGLRRALDSLQGVIANAHLTDPAVRKRLEELTRQNRQLQSELKALRDSLRRAPPDEPGEGPAPDTVRRDRPRRGTGTYR